MDSPSADKPLVPLNGGVQRNLSLNSGGTLISEEDIVSSVKDFEMRFKQKVESEERATGCGVISVNRTRIHSMFTACLHSMQQLI